MHDATNVDDPYYDEHDAAAIIGCSVWTVRRWRQTGEGPRYTKFGTMVRYRRSWLDEFADDNSRLSTAK